jgi:hypothetical protein
MVYRSATLARRIVALGDRPEVRVNRQAGPRPERLVRQADEPVFGDTFCRSALQAVRVAVHDRCMANAKKKEEGAEGFLETVEGNFRKSYAGRLKKARDLQRQAESRAEAEALRASATLEDAERQIAEIKRGNSVNLLEICGSAAAGLALGIAAQKMMDVRVQGVPVNGVLGLAGVGLGVVLEEDFPVRAVFAVGGAMFAAGSLAYAYMTPAPPDPAPTEV